jgi:hypothetical protein
LPRPGAGARDISRGIASEVAQRRASLRKSHQINELALGPDEREVAATSGRQASAGTWKRTWDLWCIKAQAQIDMEERAKRRRRK